MQKWVTRQTKNPKGQSRQKLGIHKSERLHPTKEYLFTSRRVNPITLLLKQALKTVKDIRTIAELKLGGNLSYFIVIIVFFPFNFLLQSHLLGISFFVKITHFWDYFINKIKSIICVQCFYFSCFVCEMGLFLT